MIQTQISEAAFQFDDIELTRAPFLYFVAHNVLSASLAADLVAWLQQDAPWHLHQGAFFEQYECNLLEATLPPACLPLLARPNLRVLRERVGLLLEQELAERATITAHSLHPGQGIGVHNDAPSHGRETHRLVLYLGEEFADEQGGHLVFFNSGDPGDVHRIFRPIHNSAVGFAMSDRSYHAVNEVREGRRYSIVFSFWAAGAAVEEGAAAEDALADLTRLLEDAGAGGVRHSGGTLLTHLVATYRLLESWAGSPTVCIAGLLHSIYGTDAFRVDVVSHQRRDTVQRAVGEEAERLAYLFGTVSHDSLAAAAGQAGAVTLEDFATKAPVLVSAGDLSGLLLIDLANSVEQLERIEYDRAQLHAERAVYERAAHQLTPRAIEAMRTAYDARARRMLG
jgi:hypothetical protein